MRTMPAGLQRISTAARRRCAVAGGWRPAAEAIGFTDHDRDLSFDGTLFEAEAGLHATEIDGAGPQRRQSRGRRRL